MEQQPLPFWHGHVTVTTARRRVVRIRHIVPDDVDLLVDLFRRLSPETRRRRFMHLRPDLPDTVVVPEARQLATINPALQAALLGIVEEDQSERAVGVARLSVDAGDPGVAEFAIVVRDDYQGERLGTVLLDLLLQVALVRGLRRLYGVTLAENRAIYRLVNRTGLPFTSQTQCGETTLTIQLD